MSDTTGKSLMQAAKGLLLGILIPLTLYGANAADTVAQQEIDHALSQLTVPTQESVRRRIMKSLPIVRRDASGAFSALEVDGVVVDTGGVSAAADLTDIGAVGLDLALAETVADVHTALSYGTTMTNFLQADGNVLARVALGAQTQDDFLDDIVAANGVCANGEFLSFNGTNIVCAAVPGGGDLLAANDLADVADAPTALANLGGVAATGGTATTLSLVGITTVGGTETLTAAAMAADEIDITKARNTKTVPASNPTYTFSDTPANGQTWALELTGDTAARLVTIPSTFDMHAGATRTTFIMPASGKATIYWQNDGSVNRAWGIPPALDNYTATAAPDPATDDASLGYAVGSVWVNITADVAYECLDATDGAAVWRRSSGASEERIVIAISDETTSHTTGTAKVTFRMPYAMVLTAVRGSLSTASSSGIPTWDINEAGSTILSTKLTIDANEKTSTTAAAAAVIGDNSLADDAEITVDIDTAGTGATGGKITLIGYRL